MPNNGRNDPYFEASPKWGKFAKQNLSKMTIERTDKEIIIKLPATTGTEDVQRLLDYLSYKTAVEASRVKQEQVDQMAREVNKSWWEANKDKLLRPLKSSLAPISPSVPS